MDIPQIELPAYRIPQSFIEREKDRLFAALCAGGRDQPRYAEIHAAQQALAWALDPSTAMSPTQYLLGECAKSINVRPAHELIESSP